MEQYALIIIGAAAVCYGFICALRLKQSKQWIAVRGSIIKSIKKIEYSEYGRMEYADIAYEYIFAEEKYTSQIIKIGGDMLSSPSKQNSTKEDDLLNKYTVGKIVDVYVNPQHPKVACLEKTGTETIFISFLCGAMAIVVGLYFEEITNFFF